MHLEFHGGASEVGRSCIEINGELLLDAGVKLGKRLEYPGGIDYPSIKAVLVTHAHLDHCGALPLFIKRGLRCPILCTRETRDIMFALLDDAYHLQEHNQDYSIEDVQLVHTMLTVVEEGVTGKVRDYSFRFIPAGHIPGSASILVERGGKTLLYTGDINTINTELMTGARELPHVDTLICEATYGDEDHEERASLEEHFIETVQRTIKRGGSVIIPAFGVGRSQEILIILEKLDLSVPVYLDGLARKISEIFFHDSREIRDAALLRRSLKKAIIVTNFAHREKVMKTQGIFLTTSGMVEGGPVISYIQHFYKDMKSTIILTGYQAENTNGRRLLKHESLELDGKMYLVQCEVQMFGFSAHAGRKELLKLIADVNPSLLILNHGDVSAVQFLKREVLKELPHLTAETPRVGDSLDIE